MSVLNHVTIHVPPGTLADPDLEEFWELLGFREVKPDDIHEHGWNVRWFRIPWRLWGAESSPAIHLVEGIHFPKPCDPESHDRDVPALGHICVSSCVGYKTLEQSKFLQRSSGSGRIWVGLANIRVEVRP